MLMEINDVKPVRQFKDRLFCAIFGWEENKKYLVELYNALNDSNYTNINDFEITTLENVIYIKANNDVSFIFMNQLCLYEHQSTFNPNMPIRGLLYYAELYSKYFAQNRLDFYSFSLQKIPTPKFIVFYNGTSEIEDLVKFRLSDAFINKDTENEYEWTATMLNINSGHNKKLMEKCKCLKEYATYVNMIRENLAKGMNRKDAVSVAMNSAIHGNFLDGFFRNQKAEVVSMSLTECDMDEFFQNRFNEGKREGEFNKAIETAKNLINMGLKTDQISKATGLTIEKVEELKGN